MQKVKIPITLDPYRAAQRGMHYEGAVQPEQLTRLQKLVEGIESEVAVKVYCQRDEQGLIVLKGELRAQVQVLCQRCNEQLGLDLVQHFAYSPVDETQSEDIPEYYDSVSIDDHGEINLLALIEDELILAVPIVPMHDEEDCAYSEAPMSFGDIEAVQEKPNPFEILKQLKKDS